MISIGTNFVGRVKIVKWKKLTDEEFYNTRTSKKLPKLNSFGNFGNHTNILFLLENKNKYQLLKK